MPQGNATAERRQYTLRQTWPTLKMSPLKIWREADGGQSSIYGRLQIPGGTSQPIEITIWPAGPQPADRLARAHISGCFVKVTLL